MQTAFLLDEKPMPLEGSYIICCPYKADLPTYCLCKKLQSFRDNMDFIVMSYAVSPRFTRLPGVVRL